MSWLAGLLAVVLGASYLGAVHPAADSLAVVRPVLAVALLGVGWWVWGGWALIAPVVVFGPMLWAARPVAPVEPELTLYQKNISFRLPAVDPLVEDIRASGADVVTLEELHGRLLPMLDLLKPDYPHQFLCNAHPVGKVAILSKWPLSDTQCIEWEGLGHARVHLPGGEVTVVAQHLHWPWPMKQPDQLGKILPEVAALPHPVIVAGDFNMVERTSVLRRYRRLTDTFRAGPERFTFWIKGRYPMAIDHVLVPKGWRASSEVRPLLGSDHFGLLVRMARDD